MAERPSEEPKLSDAELAQNANRLIEELKDAISGSPDFQETLGRTYFSIIPGELEGLKTNPLPFQRDGFLYTVLYRVAKDRNAFLQHELRVEKSLPGEENKGRWDQVSLLAGGEGLGKEFTWGQIQFARFSFPDHTQEVHTHTATAVQKIEEFLAEFKQPNAPVRTEIPEEEIERMDQGNSRPHSVS